MREANAAHPNEVMEEVMTDDPDQCMELLLGWRKMKYTELADAIDLNEKNNPANCKWGNHTQA